ncbi:DUF975 family protein [Anaerorhabdus sp.]|uniref:DUF975 family protein n=1 Tax=Anaerorhabdus sp. TaxID=1872524 RepID=UPI002FC9836D
MDIRLIMQRAKAQIKNNMGVLATCTLLTGIVSYALNRIGSPFEQLYFFLILPALELGFILIYLSIIDRKEIQVSDVLAGFNDYGRIIVANLCMVIFITLWSFLLIIPGIIKIYSYSMTFYILAEDPTISPIDAITKSKEMMQGNKLDLFCMHLSFFGWFILCIITLGIALLYVGPYIGAAQANFYRTLVNKNKDSVDVNVEPIEVI